MFGRTLVAAGIVLFVAHSAFGCKCADVPSFCTAFPNPADKETAIFAGIVRDIYPAESPDECARALFPYVSSFDTFTPSLDDLRNGLLRVWRGILSPAEELKLKEAESEDDLEGLFEGLSWSLPRRIRLDVIERFSGPDNVTFELFTGMGQGDCGVEFEVGGPFLVVAHRDATTGRWSTTICSGTRAIRYTDSELLALRAWKKGAEIVPIASGSVEDLTNRREEQGIGFQPLANVELMLRSAKEKWETVTDSDGHFSFANLSHKVYQLDAKLPGWRFLQTSDRDRKVDLTKSSCAELFVMMEHVQAQVPGH
jgi:hypothetical protein